MYSNYDFLCGILLYGRNVVARSTHLIMIHDHSDAFPVVFGLLKLFLSFQNSFVLCKSLVVHPVETRPSHDLINITVNIHEYRVRCHVENTILVLR